MVPPSEPEHEDPSAEASTEEEADGSQEDTAILYTARGAVAETKRKGSDWRKSSSIEGLENARSA